MSFTRRTSKRRSAVVATVVVGVLVAPVPAVAATPGYDWTNYASYQLTVGGAPLETTTDIPRRLEQHFGYAEVDLLHDRGQPLGLCNSLGAGYWLSQEIEGGLLGAGAAPPSGYTGGYRNPTFSRSVNPDHPSPDAFSSTQSPELDNYFGTNELLRIPHDGIAPVRWTADCPSDVAGTATGDNLHLTTVRSLGSTAVAQFDRVTGDYVGTARGYLADVWTGLATVESITSMMQVTMHPGAEPRVSYRLTVAGQDAAGRKSSLNQGNLSIAGTDVPLSELIDQFDDQVASDVNDLTVLGPTGLILLRPQVGKDSYGNFSVRGPVLATDAGLFARAGTIGQDQGLVLGTTQFSGSYAYGPAPKVPPPAAVTR
jgi:hypothetical protein